MTQADSDSNGSSPQPTAQTAAPAELESYRAQAVEARREADEYRNRYLRAAADMDNARKQATRDAAVRAGQDKRQLLRDFLEVADTLEMALLHRGGDSALYEGVKLALRQMQRALMRAGVERMEVKMGEVFDPVYHEAVEVRPATEDDGHDYIVDVVRAGYLYEGSVLRPAQVIVARVQQ